MFYRRVCALLLTSLFAVLGISGTTNAEPPFMPRTPAISPDGATVVFSFQGDLWSVSSEGGRALRLTANPAYDGNPVFNSDGAWIAFSSDRYGDDDVFVMPAEGGAPTRLTFASTDDIPQTFSPDGSSIYFSSRRRTEFPADGEIWQVPVNGGTPLAAFDFFAEEADITRDGILVLGIGRYKYGRRHYRGSYQRDIYTYKDGADPIAVVQFPGFDIRPQTGSNGRIYWLGDNDESMTRNIWSAAMDGSNPVAVTTFADDDVRWFTLSEDGSTFIIEQGANLFVMPNESGAQPVKLSIEVAADLLEKPIEYIDRTSGAEELTVAASGDELAMIVDGDVIAVNRELGGRSPVLLDGPSREQMIAFRPGGGTELLAVTDRNGEPQIVKISASDDETLLRDAGEYEVQPLTPADTPARMPVWSPDGERFAYTLGNGDLHVMDADGGGDKTLLKRWRQNWHPMDYSWSPDGQWIALSVEDEDYNTDIWVLKSDGSGEPVNITQHPKNDVGPVWSDDGRSLAWSTDRHSRQFDVYRVYLTEADDQMTREEWELWEKTRDKPKGDEEKDEEEEDVEVVIDFDEIYMRAERMTSLPGNEFAVAVHPKGDKLFFTTTIDGNNDLYSVTRFGEELTAITEGGTSPGAIQLVDGTFHFLKSGVPATVPIDGGSVETSSFETRLTLDRPGRRMQAFNEGWRILRDFFYDENMHGVDWKTIRAKYEPYAENVGNDDDFGDVMNLMLGELNASHMGFYQPWSARGTETDGYLGLRFDKSYTGEGLKVSSVLPGSPADMVTSKIEVGDILLSVNGRNVGADNNLYAALEKRADMPTEVVLKRGRKELRFDIVPVKSRPLGSLLSEQYEKQNRKKVAEATGGNVGYVYIRGMSWSEVERFEMNLYAAAHGKDALIIDVRENGGGWTTDFLLNILTQPQHAITVGRNGKPGYPQAERQIFYRWEKPIAVLCNEGSYSNAEIFSHAIKTIGRGPLIGNTTGGNVISTGGWYTQLPDAWIRLPQRGWYVWGDEQNPERNGLNQEGNGAVPDHIIVETPADKMHDRDPQLDKAIELMIQAAKDYAAQPKPIPKP
jgi:tricorn protease